MSVNNAIVHQILQDALDNHSQVSPNRNVSVPASTRARALTIAYNYVYNYRIASYSQSADVNWAAAEHYLWARAAVCDGTYSPVAMRLLINGQYDLKNVFWGAGYVVGIPAALVGSSPREMANNFIQVFRSSSNRPVSEQSLEDVAWALQGVDDGVLDYPNRNSPPPGRLVAPTEPRPSQPERSRNPSVR